MPLFSDGDCKLDICKSADPFDALHSARIVTSNRRKGSWTLALNTVRTAPDVLDYLLALADVSLVTMSICISHGYSLSHTTDVTRGLSLVSGLASLTHLVDAIPFRSSPQGLSGLCPRKTCGQLPTCVADQSLALDSCSTPIRLSFGPVSALISAACVA